jgi:hypothetical protein
LFHVSFYVGNFIASNAQKYVVILAFLVHYNVVWVYKMQTNYIILVWILILMIIAIEYEQKQYWPYIGTCLVWDTKWSHVKYMPYANAIYLGPILALP